MGEKKQKSEGVGRDVPRFVKGARTECDGGRGGQRKGHKQKGRFLTVSDSRQKEPCCSVWAKELSEGYAGKSEMGGGKEVWGEEEGLMGTGQVFSA